MSETPNPAHEVFEAKKQEAELEFNDILSSRMDWTVRDDRYQWGSAAESRIRAIYEKKASEITEAVKQMVQAQGAEVTDSLVQNYAERQKAALVSLNQRIRLILELSSQPTDIHEDKQVTTTTELGNFMIQGGMQTIEAIDAQYLVFQQLPPEMQQSYLESVGRAFRPDLFSILEKENNRQELTQADWDLLLKELPNLGAGGDKMQQAQVMLTLHNLSAGNRTELLRRITSAHDYPNYAEIVTLMIKMEFVSTGQAAEIIQNRIEVLKRMPKTKDEVARLETLLLQLGSPEMKARQAHIAEVRRKTSDYMMHHAYGHKNYAREFLTFEGMGSAIVSAIGATTIAMNVAMNLTSPLDLPSNEALWIGIGELGGGLHASHGLGGLLPTPVELAAKIAKDGYEEKDDKLAQNKAEIKMDTLNNYQESDFYATFAERIHQVYKAKTEALKEPRVDITLKDLGINKKTDLPEHFRPLWDHKEELQNKISEWAYRFQLQDTEYGLALSESKNQVAFIQDTRSEAKITPFKIYELPPFDYKPVKE